MTSNDIKPCAKCGCGTITVNRTESGIEVRCEGCGNHVEVKYNKPFLKWLMERLFEIQQSATEQAAICEWNEKQ